VPTTSRLALPYPTDDDANDVAGHLLALVNKLDTDAAADLQGTLSARPAAGVRGRFYTVAGDTSANNGRWFRDNGTTWVELPALGVVTSYTPSVEAASGIVPTKVADGSNFAEYTLLGNLCHVEVRQKMTFAGSASYDYRISLPIDPIRHVHGVGVTQNDGGMVYADLTWTGVTMRHARVFGGSGDLIVAGGPFFEMFTITHRFR
jgi:hypothetical protein